MPDLLSSPTSFLRATQAAASRGVLPTALGSGEIRRQFGKSLWQRSVFSARTTNAVYLDAVSKAIQRALEGGYDSDRGKLRMELKAILTRLGYTPERGFPGDESLGIPPAEPGSLQDLSSDRRINLILETQERLYRGAGQQERGHEPAMLWMYPAWELVRILPRERPRGSPGSGTAGWDSRWTKAGGPVVTVNQSRRWIALKNDPVWQRLGDARLADDALDVAHPPFAFSSGS